MFGKKLFTITVYLVFVSTTVFANKSVFIISQHGFPPMIPSRAQAYAIDSNTVIYQDDVDITSYNPGNGAVGLATWPEKELMFVTYEGSGVIVWSSTKTLEKIGDYNTQIGNAAGIGAQHCLLDKDLRNKAQELLKKIKYVEIAIEPNFQKEYAEAMYFPHLKLELFKNLREYEEIPKR